MHRRRTVGPSVRDRSCAELPQHRPRPARHRSGASPDGPSADPRTEEFPMRDVTYSLSVSLDGYIVGPDGGFDWSFPDAEVFRLATDEVRGAGVHLMGRRLYETMLSWETTDQDPSSSEAELEFASLWTQLPKVVFSTTLQSVRGTNTRLAAGTVAQEVERLRAETAGGDIAIGGATLAADAVSSGLVDEYRMRVYPVLVGGGTPFFPRGQRRSDLDLVESRTLGSRVLLLRYRTARP